MQDLDQAALSYGGPFPHPPRPSLAPRVRAWNGLGGSGPVYQTTAAWESCGSPVRAADRDRSIDKAYRIKLARRWLVERPLQRQWDRVDDIIRDTRGTSA